MNYKPDNKCGNREDITFLSEIITNYRYWQGILKVCKSNFYVTNTTLRFIVLL